MCGIAGTLGIKDEKLVREMLKVMRHRGPDASCWWSDAEFPIALGHNRLSILDLTDRGKQPMWDASGRFCITYNGEIYNYRELRNSLEAKGYHFRSATDTEVLLNLFREKGPACAEELKGIWAFAIWDASIRKLFVSRDPFGVKPLYYVTQGDAFLFSSEIKGFLSWKNFSKDVDEAAVFETMLYLWTPGPRTLFSHVRKLPPGQTLCVRPGETPVVVHTVDVKTSKDLAGKGTVSIEELLREQLHRSVQSQLVSDVPVGAFLSGGLDSSAVVAMAERDGRRISRCYTINYADGRNWEGMTNDIHYARKVARSLGVECVEITLESSVLSRVREMVWHLDEPQADLAPLNVLLISQAARANGDYVLLSGAGGDDIFSGYRRHTALHLEKWWRWMPHSMRSGLRFLSEHSPASGAFGRRFKRMFRYADQTDEERLFRYFTWSPQQYVMKLIHRDMRQRLLRHDPLRVMRDAMQTFRGTDPIDKMLFLDTRFFLADHNLNYTDKMGMACGVEIRVPLIDSDLVKLAFEIPSNLKQKGMIGKYIFKRAMEPFLPQEVIYRPKTGFVAPVREWMLGPLYQQIRTVLSDEALRQRGWFSPKAIQRLFKDVENNHKDLHYLLLSVYLIEEWARMFIDGDRP